MEWLKLWTQGVLRGSLSHSDDIVQLTWIKLLAMAGEARVRNGRLEYKNGIPYERHYIAATCGITPEILEGCICEFKEDVSPESGIPRITVEEDGTIVINNWKAYQDSKEDKKRQQDHMIKKSEEKRHRELCNKYPNATISIIETDFGYEVIDKKNGEILEKVEE